MLDFTIITKIVYHPYQWTIIELRTENGIHDVLQQTFILLW